MFRFLKINPQTLYAHLSQEELHALGIDVENDTIDMKKRIMEVVTKSLAFQEEMPMDEPLTINVTMTKEGMQILVTAMTSPIESVHSEDVWRHLMEGMDDIIEILEEETVETVYVFRFSDFEELLLLIRVFPRDVAETLLSHLYVYDASYYLVFDFFQAGVLDEIKDVLSVVEEYGILASVTPAVLEEYGKQLIEDGAIEELYDQFFNPTKKSN